MRCLDIISLALAYINESADSCDTADMRRRMPPLLAAVITELTPLDRAVERNDKKNYPPFSELASGDGDFPLCDALASLCALRLGSVVICDENEALSSRLFNEYKLSLSTVMSTLPAEVKPITDVYG